MRRLREEPRRAHEEQREPGERRPAARHERPYERRRSPHAQEQREEKAPVPERLDGGPGEPHADGTHRAVLRGGRPRGIERRERDQAEPGDRQREDPLHLAPPAVAASPAVPPGLVFGREERGHQTSRMIGSTTGLRRNRWGMKCRTAARTTAPASPTDLPSTRTRPAGKRPTTCAAVFVTSTPVPSSIRKIRSGSRPTDSASRAWLRRCRYSPCTGMKYRGRVRFSISFRSSWLAWPETWTNALSS